MNFKAIKLQNRQCHGQCLKWPSHQHCTSHKTDGCRWANETSVPAMSRAYGLDHHKITTSESHVNVCRDLDSEQLPAGSPPALCFFVLLCFPEFHLRWNHVMIWFLVGADKAALPAIQSRWSPVIYIRLYPPNTHPHWAHTSALKSKNPLWATSQKVCQPHCVYGASCSSSIQDMQVLICPLFQLPLFCLLLCWWRWWDVLKLWAMASNGQSDEKCSFQLKSVRKRRTKPWWPVKNVWVQCFYSCK